MRVSVIGLGTMGAPMARHLLEAGHEVTVHNRTREREQPLAELGAARAASPAEAAAGAEVLLTCVSDSPDLLEVLFGAGGAAEGLAAGAVVCDCSTISPSATVEAAGRLAERGTLTIFVGGEPDHVAVVRPVLETFGSRITHLGPAGSGQLAKAVNQVMIAGTYATVGEGIALAEAAGLPLDALVEALGQGAAASWVLENRAGNMIGNSYPLGFKVQLHRKDLGIALDEAARLGVQMPVSRLVGEEEDELIADGHGDEDVSALARLPRRRDGG
jgi:3-hydroxyisobutyrate dehydrogenase-like beta-hydroxyacid dehydrogenase